MSETQTVFVSIGNSDDKLAQKEWAQFCTDLFVTVHALAEKFLGEWHSLPGQPWQNMCFAADMSEGARASLLRQLESLRVKYRQDSIAVLPGKTIFVGEQPEIEP